MTEEYSKQEQEPKTVFESLLEKEVKGAENLPYSISLNDEPCPVNPFNWKFDGRYDWKANFPYSPPKENVIRRFIVAKIFKKYYSL